MEKSLKQFIAIDGGGTKTDVVWFDEIGNVIKRVIGKAANPNGLSKEQVHINLSEVFIALDLRQSITIEALYGGFSGGDHPENQRLIESIVRELAPNIKQIKIGNDAINALWSGTDGEPGLVLIAGTGSIVFGVDDKRQTFRIGGWGHLIGDEGSGYDIGRKAATRVMKAYDGRGSSTKLTELIKHKYHLKSEEDLIPLVYQQGKTFIASLVPFVVEAAYNYDIVALNIIEETANKLAALVNAAFKKFSQPPEKMIFVGGLQNIGDLLLDPFRQALDNPNAAITFPELPPVYGAAIECLLYRGSRASKEFKSNFIKSINISIVDLK